MDQKDRDIITDNYVVLNRDLTPNGDFLAYLRQSGVLTPRMFEDIEEASSTSKKRSMILRIIPTRGPKAFENFVRALRKSGQEHLADLLDPKPVETPRENMMAIQEEGGILTINVQSVVEDVVDGFRRNNYAKCYKLERNPRGRCIIVNNQNFYTMNDRDGSEKDETNLKELFTKLHFEVDVWKNLELKEVKDRLEKEKSNTAHKTADAFIFIVMSHGTEGCIFTVDGEKLQIEADVVENFSGASCPALSGKPKIFLIQACQGRNFPSGVPQADSPDPRVDNLTAAVKQLAIETDKGDKVHERGDVLIAYATLPGYVALRVPELGSWFMREFVISCMELAHENHILDILMVVAGRVQAKQKPGLLQATRTDVRLSKHFYFFPGYFHRQ